MRDKTSTGCQRIRWDDLVTYVLNADSLVGETLKRSKFESIVTNEE